MDGLEIHELLKNDKCFLGTFARDELPYQICPPATFIANTDKKADPGTHWVAIHIDDRGKGVYFDSFGLPPLKKEFVEYLDKHCFGGWHYNDCALQNVNSLTCGKYCILFVKFVCRKIPVYDFFKLFNRNTNLNDVLINDIVK
jgi:hypothetical protein